MFDQAKNEPGPAAAKASQAAKKPEPKKPDQKPTSPLKKEGSTFSFK